MRVKLALGLVVLFFGAAWARADSVFTVTIPKTTMEDGDTAALSFNWDANTQAISDINLALGNAPSSDNVAGFAWTSVTTYFVPSGDPNAGGLELLELDGPNGSYFQIDMSGIYDLPPLLPELGEQFVGIALNCPTSSGGTPPGGCELSGGNIEFAGADAIITDPPSVATPEPSSLLLSALGVAVLIGFARQYHRQKSGQT
jgi:PEP-CTERM motif-containing protein